MSLRGSGCCEWTLRMSVCVPIHVCVGVRVCVCVCVCVCCCCEWALCASVLLLENVFTYGQVVSDALCRGRRRREQGRYTHRCANWDIFTPVFALFTTSIILFKIRRCGTGRRQQGRACEGRGAGKRRRGGGV